jgi:hypothetical protein
MKTIANVQPVPSLKAVALAIDVPATLMRRVLPLSLALGAWVLMIEAGRLIF